MGTWAMDHDVVHASEEAGSATEGSAGCLPTPCPAHPTASGHHDMSQQPALPSTTPCPGDALPCVTLHDVSLTEETVAHQCTVERGSKVAHPMAIQIALAVAFIVASLLSAMFATTCLSRCIWRTSNAVFGKLASISDAMTEEIQRSRRESHIVVVSDMVKVVMTRRYVHGMRYWQDMAMTVVQLANYTVFYNPVPVPIEDMRALARGQQVVVVVPNMYHHMFVDDYLNAFPSAILCGSQCAAERHAPRLAVALPSTLALPADVELLHVDGFALDEYIMVVHSERLFSAAHFISCGIELSVGGATLLPTWLKRAVCKASGWHPAGCLPIYERLAVSDKAAVASFVTRLLALEMKTCVSAHGGICEDHAQKVLRRAWGWAIKKYRCFGLCS
eukprot:TRINITY_DN10512_c0_g1_i1.p1 TRINITY_DN10512_c0_g1~~TRINITY_DN10512_c0_g1_i1.p1  ORF type:complete len:390 (-),score=40.22 TRINITY_DN10512_c0_g1_i1:20-1189(-)